MANRQPVNRDEAEYKPSIPENSNSDVPKNETAVNAETAQTEEQSDHKDAGFVIGSKRRMPDNLRRFLVRMQGGKYYLPAAYRIVWFRDELGDDWGIKTQLIEGGHEAGFATVYAEIISPDGRVIASDMKTETRQDFPAGWVEKASTGAVARALALIGFGTQFIPELDDDYSRPADSPRSFPPHINENSRARKAVAAPTAPAEEGDNNKQTIAQDIWTGPGQCPRCHAPEGKRHGKPCIA